MRHLKSLILGLLFVGFTATIQGQDIDELSPETQFLSYQRIAT